MNLWYNAARKDNEHMARLRSSQTEPPKYSSTLTNLSFIEAVCVDGGSCMSMVCLPSLHAALQQGAGFKHPQALSSCHLDLLVAFLSAPHLAALLLLFGKILLLLTSSAT